MLNQNKLTKKNQKLISAPRLDLELHNNYSPIVGYENETKTTFQTFDLDYGIEKIRERIFDGCNSNEPTTAEILEKNCEIDSYELNTLMMILKQIHYMKILVRNTFHHQHRTRKLK